jgi:CrcB protein
VARYLLAVSVQRWSGSLFPLGTLCVNVAGCLAIGFLATRAEASALPAHYRLGLLVGVLGGFTTFSSFSWETLQLFERRESLYAAGNVLLSVLVCLLACWAGQRLATSLMR